MDRKYIFPGGYIPTKDEMLSAAKAAGLELATAPFRHEGFNYAETLRRWRKRFRRAYPELDPQKYDSRFKRMWEFYLAGSEASFEKAGLELTQMLFTAPNGSMPPAPKK